MALEIKTFDEWSDYYNNLCTADGVDTALIGDFEKKKLVSLPWLIKQIRHEIDLVNQKRCHQFDDNHAYQAGMHHILTLLEG